ncbi:MAG: hypothetical protein H6Q72_4752 [Firmicutes bacterium]|nr:hypothetical protein [Bacillota bacterium]
MAYSQENRWIEICEHNAEKFDAGFTGLDERTTLFLKARLYQHNADLFSLIESCESPIEKILVTGLFAFMDDIELVVENGAIWRIPQAVIKCCGKVYRADLLLGFSIKGKEYSLIIECDGHNFHEKTKKQAQHDKERDRNLTVDGYVVMHFTGSEIWKNPVRCGEKIFEYIYSLWKQANSKTD